MDTGDGGRPPSSSGQADDAAELAAVDAEIARLVRRREELRIRISRSVAAASSSVAATSTATATANADWYPDPTGRFSWRYWNGTEWTDAVARGGVMYTDPPIATGATGATGASGASGAIGATTSTPTSTPVTSSVPATPSATPSAPPTAPSAPSVPSAPSPVSTPQSSRTGALALPKKANADIDVGKLILIVGAALLIGGVAGLTVWLWTRLPAIGRLGILGVAFLLQTAIAVRIRERLQMAAEAFAATGAATLLFAIGSVGATATWNGTVGVSVGVVGIVLLLLARFRAWVIVGHVAIAVGATAVVVAEPWAHTAFVVAAVLGVVRWVGVSASASLRPQDVDIAPEWLTASSLVALLAVPVLTLIQFETNATAVVLILVALVVSEITVRTRNLQRDHLFSLIAGALIAVGGVGWSTYLWVSSGRSDGLNGMAVTAIVALLLWRAGHTETRLRAILLPVAIGLLPVAARFACDPASRSELIIYCAGVAIAGIVVSRIVDKSLPMWFWLGAMVASIAATELLAPWPRLALATIALVSLAPILQLDELRYAAAATATLTAVDLLYNESFATDWWYRPDIVGVVAALCLYLAYRKLSKPWTVKIGTWDVPRNWESAAALLVVPVVELVTRPTFNGLSIESKWRLGFIIALTIAAWAYRIVRRAGFNGLQLATLVAVGSVIVSRVADESPRIQTGAWVVIGCLATISFSLVARLKKIDEMRYAAAVSATFTVAVLLYGELISVSWWFRPDIVGAVAAVCLYIAYRTLSKPWTATIGAWNVPRHWESAAALLVVPVAGLVSQATFNDLNTESMWRLGFVVSLLVASWAYGAVRRARPNALQVTSLVAAAAVIVSRVADESPRIQTGAWVAIGCISTVAFAVFARLKKLDELRYAAAASATFTAAVLLYGELISVSWWFRPDIVGAVAAAGLFVAYRTLSKPWTASVGAWKVPRHWESVAALLAVPVVNVVSRPALADLPNESKWRLGFIVVLSVVAWAISAVRRTSPNAAQMVALLAVLLVVVSRIGDDSLAVRASAWVAVGCFFIVGAQIFRRVELLVPAGASWMLVVFLYSPPGPLEVLTCSLAAIAGLIGVLGRRFGRRGTLDFIPATALALVPSAFAAAKAVLNSDVDSEQVTRIAVVLVVGAIALALGAYKRLAAFVGPSVIALVVLAAAQLVVVQRRTSGWVSALIAGALLLLVGTRLEYLRSVSRRAGDLVRSLR